MVLLCRTEKPAMNTFLMPFIEERKLLEMDGLAFEENEKPVKVYVHVLTCKSHFKKLQTV